MPVGTMNKFSISADIVLDPKKFNEVLVTSGSVVTLMITGDVAGVVMMEDGDPEVEYAVDRLDVDKMRGKEDEKWEKEEGKAEEKEEEEEGEKEEEEGGATTLEKEMHGEGCEEVKI